MLAGEVTRKTWWAATTATLAGSATLGPMSPKKTSPPRDAASSYVIWRTPGAGFFSIVTSTLARFHLADEMGVDPIVDLENHDSVYREEEPVLGTRNVWEYYFEQPAGRGTSDIGDSPHITDGTWPQGYPYDLSGSPVYREMWDKYVRLNATTRKFVESSSEVLGVSSRSLAVHYRGQEMRTTLGHRYPPTLAQTNDAIRWALDHHDFDEIFLVTEAQQYVDAFIKTWGNRVNPSPSFRLKHRNSYTVTPAPRKRHRYLLGLEALRDAVLMGQSGGLICGRSNLSEAAIMLGGDSLTPLVRISQGRNSFRPYIAPVKWYLKAALPPALGGFPHWLPEK